MPTGPTKGQKRPADVIGNAVRVMQIATGEIDEDTPIDAGKDPAGSRAEEARAVQNAEEWTDCVTSNTWRDAA